MHAVDETVDETSVARSATVKAAKAHKQVKAEAHAKTANKIASRVKLKARSREIRKPRAPIRAKHKSHASRKHRRPFWKPDRLKPLVMMASKAKAAVVVVVVAVGAIVVNVVSAVSAAPVRKVVSKTQRCPQKPLSIMATTRQAMQHRQLW